MMFGTEWCGYPTVKNFEDMFIRFDRIHKRGGIGRTCIALRSKNSIFRNGEGSGQMIRNLYPGPDHHLQLIISSDW